MVTDYIISIDPGKNGFITVMQVNPVLPIECLPMPLITVQVNKKNRIKVNKVELQSLLHNLINKYSITEIVIEEQRVQSKQGLTSTGSTMHHFGWLEGFCSGTKVKCLIVPPKEWQLIYPLYIASNETFEAKDKSKLYCSILFPDLDLRKSPRSKVISDGKTDSILIGMYRVNQLNAA
jgi:hypothetical protein